MSWYEWAFIKCWKEVLNNLLRITRKKTIVHNLLLPHVCEPYSPQNKTQFHWISYMGNVGFSGPSHNHQINQTPNCPIVQLSSDLQCEISNHLIIIKAVE